MPSVWRGAKFAPWLGEDGEPERAFEQRVHDLVRLSVFIEYPGVISARDGISHCLQLTWSLDVDLKRCAPRIAFI